MIDAKAEWMQPGISDMKPQRRQALHVDKFVVRGWGTDIVYFVKYVHIICEEREVRQLFSVIYSLHVWGVCVTLKEFFLCHATEV